MTFRTIGEGEFKALLEIAFKSFYRGAVRLIYSPEEHFINTFNSLSLALRQPDLCLLGVEERGKLIGAILGYGDPKQKIYHCPFIWVDKESRNKRIGTRLGAVLYKHAETLGYGNFVVEADSSNGAVKKILKSMSFHQARVTWVKAKV